ncbi:MAG: ATP synthase F1 subunit delta [Acidimicrobiales bacterium]
MNPTLEGYTAAVLEFAPAEARPGLAGELESIERLVLDTPALRAALTDTAVKGPARLAVMNDLFGGRVSPTACRAAAFATSVVSAPDVLAALAWLAVRARHAAEGRPMPDETLGLTESRRRVGGYAQAVFETMATAELEEVEDELFRFARIVESTPALRSALVDRDLAVEARQGLVTQLLESKVEAGTLALVRYLIAAGRARDVVGSLDWLVEQAAAARGWRIARVRAAAPIEDAQRTSLSESLASLTGLPVELQVEIDPDLLSGAVIRIGDLQVDATARGRIDALREHLAPGGWEDEGFRAHPGPTGTTQREGAG